MTTQTQLNRYRVFADYKAQTIPENVAKTLCFLYHAEDYKGAWTGARNICRIGGEAPDVSEGAEDGATVTIPAGQYTVRKVFAMDKRQGGKAKVITVEMLEEAAKAEGVKLNQKVQALIDKLRGGPKSQLEQPAETQEGGDADRGEPAETQEGGDRETAAA